MFDKHGQKRSLYMHKIHENGEGGNTYYCGTVAKNCDLAKCRGGAPREKNTTQSGQLYLHNNTLLFLCIINNYRGICFFGKMPSGHR